ncbi:TlpA disulfide reductase family protein [Alistipes sp. D31t1_170403_E11]|uniref:TlpA family protein disulfide reductase n=1 Tax=Alistipes sp. D31t1_170403_E11 TaxID=2787128 RepID=UPI001899E3F7|nr:TlpA disulfide reductase family protein [Alistipes sp. D31t1_170403_E11]
MKKILFALACGLLAAACCKNDKTAAEYLTEYSQSVLGSKASAIKFNAVSERDTGTETLEIYAEPNPADTIIGMRFQATGADSRVIYNGKELFVIGLRDSYTYLKKNDYETYPILKPFIPITGYAGTPFSFARVFPKIAADTTARIALLADTVIDGLKCRQISVVLQNKSIYGESLYKIPADMPREFGYKFVFSKKDGLLRGEGMANDAGSYDMVHYMDYVFNRPETDRKWMFADFPEAKPYERIKYDILAAGSPMPAFSAVVDGKGTIDRSEFAGKPTLILFWTIGCGASRSAIPVVNRLYEKYPDLTVFGLNNDDPELEYITRFVAKYGIRYTVGLGNREAALAFGVNGWPTFMLFGKDGKLRYVQMGLGATTEKTLCEEIEKTIAEK